MIDEQAPLTATVPGWVASQVPLQALFLGAAGLFLVAAALLALLFTPMRSLTDASVPMAPTPTN